MNFRSLYIKVRESGKALKDLFNTKNDQIIICFTQTKVVPRSGGRYVFFGEDYLIGLLRWLHIYHVQIGRIKILKKSTSAIVKLLTKLEDNKVPVFFISTDQLCQAHFGIERLIYEFIRPIKIIIIQNPFVLYYRVSGEMTENEFAWKWKYEITRLLLLADATTFIICQNPYYSTRPDTDLELSKVLILQKRLSRIVGDPYYFKELTEFPNYISRFIRTEEEIFNSSLDSLRYKEISKICGFEMRLLRYATVNLLDSLDQGEMHSPY